MSIPSTENDSATDDVISTLMRLVVEVSGGDVVPNPGEPGFDATKWTKSSNSLPET